jgi:hypothetical protein
VDAPAAEFDEEEYVEAAQRDRLDREEVAGSKLAACRRRNAGQLTARRRDARSSAAEASRRRTVLGEMRKPSLPHPEARVDVISR